MRSGCADDQEDQRGVVLTTARATAALSALLGGGGTAVATGAPGAAPARVLTLSLVTIASDQAARNARISGGPRTAPPLALRLTYLVSAADTDGDLLDRALALVHAHPVLTADGGEPEEAAFRIALEDAETDMLSHLWLSYGVARRPGFLILVSGVSAP
ncbi:Pvc16 family protein [Sphingomonas sp.]|uniref:Pvc16 family protein n=1 Tax=Sphingomonas sp. TaxID=28214 RepID=UPI0025E33ECB|nr:Pvc16 family protein [Sphingomonas sp.]